MNFKHLQYSVFAVALAALCGCKGTNPPDGEQPVFPDGERPSTMEKSAKRGVAFNFNQLEDLPLLSPAISWAYNWGNTQNESAALWFDTNEMDYCPMVWNNNYNADNIRNYVAAHPNTKYLLAYNEPNLTDQANMTPVQTAQQWASVVALAKELNLKLVSPAMNYGTLAGYSDPIKWLDEFFAQPGVSIDDIYAISVHCYMKSTGGLQGFIERFAKYKKPVWLTEFCAWEPAPSGVDEQMSYMTAALNYLEQAEIVERYAWFIPRGTLTRVPYNALLTSEDPISLTPLGQVYTQFSSFDKKAYLPLGKTVPANAYIALSDNGIPMRVTEDNRLYISGMQSGMWLDYQVAVRENKPLQIIYSSLSNCQLCVYMDGVAQTIVDLPKTADLNTPTMQTTTYVPAAGNHTLRLELLNGSMFYYGIKQ